jgi:hypothetical protein
MKKIFSLLTVAAFAALVACGPSAEEKAAAEKARQDSINQAMAAQMAADSAAQAMAAQARQDSMMMANRADSIAKAEAAASARKSAPKPKPKLDAKTQKVEDAKKVTGGRGH